MSTVERFGTFLPEEGCFEITNEPPRKWRNILYNKWGDSEYYAEATHIGDGAARWRDGAGNTVRVIGYDCKYLYIRDDETNLTFNPAGMPVPTDVQDRVVRIYQSKTEISSTCADLRVKQRIFVPRSEALEAWTLSLENLSDRPRKLSVFVYAKFDLHGNDNEGRGFGADNYSQMVPELASAIVVNRKMNIPVKHTIGFVSALKHFRAGCGDRDAFTRADYSLAAPRILWGWNCDGAAGHIWGAASVVQCTFELPARGSERLDFLLGLCTSQDELREIRSRLSAERLDAMDAEQMGIERCRAAAFNVNTGEENKNRDSLINIFVKKQIYAYMVDKGGVRDNLQNANGLSLFDPATARAIILKCLGVQKPNGSMLHSWRPLNRHQYSDKPAWMLQTIPWYIKETGDFSILDEEQRYFESDEKGSVWDHMQRAYRWLSNDLGRRGLCRQHFADWNDGLEPSEKTGERESIMVSQQLCAGLLEVAELCRKRGDAQSAIECMELHSRMADTLNRVAWDGEWFVRTICEDGFCLGSAKNAEARIFVNTQSWAVLGRVAEEARLRQCMASVDKYIAKPEGYAICDPPCSTFDERIGRYTTVMPYTTENGGCYNHAAGFKCVADTLLGRAEEAWETYVKVVPDSPALPLTQSGAEPYAFINCYNRVQNAGLGKGGYPWRTGTASWFAVALLEYILGARRGYDGLIIDPCLSAKVPRAKVLRRFRGASYNIEIDNTAGRCRGAREIRLDGELIKGNVLPLLTSGEHKVAVTV